MMTLGGNIDKLRRLSDELHNHLLGRGTLLRSLEELEQKLESLTKLQASKESASFQKDSIRQRLADAENLDSSLRKQVEDIRQNPGIKEYLQVDAELRALRADLIRTGFSRLGRPLKKLLSISERGDYPVPVEVRESAKEYVRKPFGTFLKEEKGYPRLKAVMSVLAKAVSSGKLPLKQREAKKVTERTEQVVSSDSLSGIHEKSLESKRTYDRVLADGQTAALVQQLRELRQKGRSNRAIQEELRAELQRAINNENRIEEQIQALLKELRDFSRKLTGTDLQVQLA
jgi:chromosome segregation ATPase